MQSVRRSSSRQVLREDCQALIPTPRTEVLHFKSMPRAGAFRLIDRKANTDGFMMAPMESV
jgi:hypothetical protein